LASLERGRVPSPRPIASKEVPLVDRAEEMDVLKEAVFRRARIYERETEKGRGKYLKIQKMSKQKYLEEELPLRKEQP